MGRPRHIVVLFILISTFYLITINPVNGDIESNDSPDFPEYLYSGIMEGSVSDSVNGSDVDYYRIQGKGEFEFDLQIVNLDNGSTLQVFLYEYYPPDRGELVNKTIQPGVDYSGSFDGFFDGMVIILEISGNGSYQIILAVNEYGPYIEEPYVDDVYYEEESVIFSPLIFSGVCVLFIVIIIIIAVIAAFVIAIYMLNRD